MIAVAGYL